MRTLCHPQRSSDAHTAGAQLHGVSDDAAENTLALQLYALPVRFKTYRCWLNMPEYWHAGFVYMCSRLVVNVSQVFLPFYITDVLHLSPLYFTIFPCVLFVSSLLSAAVMQRL